MSDPDNITFKIGNYEWKGRAISYLINDIKKAMNTTLILISIISLMKSATT